MASPWPLTFSSGERPRALWALLFLFFFRGGVYKISIQFMIDTIIWCATKTIKVLSDVQVYSQSCIVPRSKYSFIKIWQFSKSNRALSPKHEMLHVLSGDAERRGTHADLPQLHLSQQAPVQGEDRPGCWLWYWHSQHVCCKGWSC